MLWETLKKRVADGIYHKVCYGGYAGEVLEDLVFSDFEAKKGRTRAEMVLSYANAARDRIMDWDIRCVGKLRALFPSHFPKSLQNGDLCAGMDEDARWQVTNGI